MQVVTITAVSEGGMQAITVVDQNFDKAVAKMNMRLAAAYRRMHGESGSWISMDLPDGDASVIRHTSLGNIRFMMERHKV